MMSPGGSIVASFENVESFLAVHTSPDHLIRTYFKQEGVVPEIVFNIFEKLVFLLGRHALHNESTRVIAIINIVETLPGAWHKPKGNADGLRVEANLGIKTRASVKLNSKLILYERFIDICRFVLSLIKVLFIITPRRNMGRETGGFSIWLREQQQEQQWAQGLDYETEFEQQEVLGWSTTTSGVVAGAGSWFLLVMSNARTISFSSATSMKQLGWKSCSYLGKQLPWLCLSNLGLALDDF
ncbi:hypothetical protein Tco_0146168 [Tanacetum coccineum]